MTARRHAEQIREAIALAITLALALAIAITLASCSRGGADDEKSDGASGPVIREVSEGPVAATARLDRGEWTVGDLIELSLDVRAESGVEVEMPDPGARLGPFTVRDARRPPDVPDGAHRRWTHRFTLETFESGDLEIPPLVIEFTDRRGDEPVTGRVSFEPIVLSVRSTIAPDADAGAIVALRDPAEIDLPGEPLPWRTVIISIVAGAILIGAAVTALVWLRKHRAADDAEIPLAPHEWAMRELDRLAADALLERGELRSFYFRLTDIVRGYIERRFELAAPEQTTDEFLRVARRHPTLTARDQERLGAFLRGADLVKFARFEPSRADGEAAFLLARSFVEETTPPQSGQAAERSHQEAAHGANDTARTEAAA